MASPEIERFGIRQAQHIADDIRSTWEWVQQDGKLPGTDFVEMIDLLMQQISVVGLRNTSPSSPSYDAYGLYVTSVPSYEDYTEFNLHLKLNTTLVQGDTKRQRRRQWAKIKKGS